MCIIDQCIPPHWPWNKFSEILELFWVLKPASGDKLILPLEQHMVSVSFWICKPSERTNNNIAMHSVIVVYIVIKRRFIEIDFLSWSTIPGSPSYLLCVLIIERCLKWKLALVGFQLVVHLFICFSRYPSWQLPLKSGLYSNI